MCETWKPVCNINLNTSLYAIFLFDGEWQNWVLKMETAMDCLYTKYQFVLQGLFTLGMRLHDNVVVRYTKLLVVWRFSFTIYKTYCHIFYFHHTL